MSCVFRIVSCSDHPVLGITSARDAAIDTTQHMLTISCQGRRTAVHTTMQPAALLHALPSTSPPCCRCYITRTDVFASLLHKVQAED